MGLLLLLLLVIVLAVLGKEGTDERGDLQVGVCITGQMKRLEIRSKVDNFLKPHFRGKVATFDVVFSLSNYSAPVFSNPLQISKPNATPPSEITHDAVDEAFSPYVRYLMFTEVSPLEVVFNDRYVNSLGRTNTDSRFKSIRARSQVTVWYNMRRCFDEFLNIESRDHFQYDMFVHIREDAFLLKLLDPRELLRTVQWATPDVSASTSKVVIHPSCSVTHAAMSANQQHDVFHDTAALVTRAGGYDFFYSPLDDYYLFWHEMLREAPVKKGEIIGPQRFLYRVYSRRNITLLSNSTAVPVAQSIPLEFTNARERQSPPPGPTCLIFNKRHAARTVGCLSNALELPPTTISALGCEPVDMELRRHLQAARAAVTRGNGRASTREGTVLQ